jgi:GT2 family glycosyltransferase
LQPFLETMNVAIVILNYNGKELLEKFLPALLAHSQEEAQIIIADNCSTDSSVKFIKTNYPQLRIIQLAENTGYAGGYNAALKQVDAEIYVLLNSDVEVTANWMEPALRLFNSDATIGACQPKILSYNQKDFFEHAGAAGGFIDWLGYPFCRGRILETTEPDHGQYSDSRKIFWASGACLFIRSKLFHELGGFDKDFFAHMEEIDLCWRIQKSGSSIYYLPDSCVYHVGGGTLSKSSPRKTYYNFRNNILMLHKNLSFFRMLFVLIIRFFLDLIAAIKFSLEGNRQDSVSVIKAYGWFYSNIFERIKIRRATRRMASSKKAIGILNKSLVFNYYLLGKSKFSHFHSNSFSK